MDYRGLKQNRNDRNRGITASRLGGASSRGAELRCRLLVTLKMDYRRLKVNRNDRNRGITASRLGGASSHGAELRCRVLVTKIEAQSSCVAVAACVR